ncbi:MAG: site-specific integrase [Phyllobacteriaceae bacterium]|nr:site-specific integrase [Phyllobacteriaceae bacterium]
MSRRHDPSRARRHWIYARDELCDIFDVGDSTISNWIRRGLPPVDTHRPQIFAGFEVRRFLTNLRWPHGRLPDHGRLFCHFCSQFMPLSLHAIQNVPDGLGRVTVRGMATNCDNMLQATVPQAMACEIWSAALNTARHSSDVLAGRSPGSSGDSCASVPPETHTSNLRRLYHYRVFLEQHEELQTDTVDEHLRSLARISAVFGHRPFEEVEIADVVRLKDKLRELRSDGESGRLSPSTVTHTLWHGGAFFRWLSARPGVKIDPHLPGYFNLSRREQRVAADAVKGAGLTFDQAACIFREMLSATPTEKRNRSIFALFIVTGMRIGALVTLRGKHVNMDTRWINQDPREVDTKDGKHIRTYCLDLGHGLIDAIRIWSRWRTENGFGAGDAFFLPDRYLQPNGLGLGFAPSSESPASCWKSDDQVRQIIKNAAANAGFDTTAIASHDFRKTIHPFLARCGAMTVAEEVALQLNFGHTPTETIRKHYARMPEAEREAILDELCRRALSSRTELELYLAFERGEIADSDPDFERARGIFRRNMLPSDR